MTMRHASKWSNHLYTPVPKHVQVQHVAKLAPTPVGVSLEELKEWIEKVGLPARPIKPLHHKAWLLGFSKQVDELWYTWNSQVMLLTFMPNKSFEQKRHVVAGFVPVKEHSVAPTKEGPFTDAWAEYRQKHGMSMPGGVNQATAAGTNTPVATTAVPRTTQGPIEERFKQQDLQIDSLKQVVTDLRQTVEQTQKSQSEFHQTVDKKMQGLQQDMQTQMQKMGETFEQSVYSAIHKQERQMNDSFRELKLLITQKPEAKKKARTSKPAKDSGEKEDDEGMDKEDDDDF